MPRYASAHIVGIGLEVSRMAWYGWLIIILGLIVLKVIWV